MKYSHLRRVTSDFFLIVRGLVPPVCGCVYVYGCVHVYCFLSKIIYFLHADKDIAFFFFLMLILGKEHLS